MNKKKEYVAPQMEMFEYVVKTSLLQGSPNQDKADSKRVLEDDYFD